jgi:hypothetical protein
VRELGARHVARKGEARVLQQRWLLLGLMRQCGIDRRRGPTGLGDGEGKARRWRRGGAAVAASGSPEFRAGLGISGLGVWAFVMIGED